MIPSRKVTTLLAALSLAVTAFGSPVGKVRNHFDSDRMAFPPAYFDFAVLGAPGPATWRVLFGENLPSPTQYLSQVENNRPADSIAVAVRRNVLFADGTTSVAVRKGQDRAGIAFRIADDSNFRVLLVDMTSGQAHLVAYENGKAMELAQGSARLDRDWSYLEIVTKGPRIVARWNGQPLLEATDPSPTPGRAGVATAGPGVAGFDEFVLEPEPVKN